MCVRAHWLRSWIWPLTSLNTDDASQACFHTKSELMYPNIYHVGMYLCHTAERVYPAYFFVVRWDITHWRRFHTQKSDWTVLNCALLQSLIDASLNASSLPDDILHRGALRGSLLPQLHPCGTNIHKSQPLFQHRHSCSRRQLEGSLLLILERGEDILN